MPFLLSMYTLYLILSIMFRIISVPPKDRFGTCRRDEEEEPKDHPPFVPSATNRNKPMNTTYTTSDFYASAFLVASGVPLFSHFRSNGKTTFEFRQTDGLNQLIDEYYAD